MGWKPLDLFPGSTLRRAFERVVAAVPGTEFFDVSAREERHGEQSVVLSFEGWSPTLHRIRIDLRSGLPNDVDPSLTHEHLAWAALQGLGPGLAAQSKRAMDAAALGADAPLPYREISHLHVDNALASLVARAGGDVRNNVRQAIGELHGAVTRSDGGPAMESAVHFAAERPHPEGPATRFVSTRHVVRDARRRPVAYLDAPYLDVVCQPLPDSVLSAIVGAPLGRFAQVDVTVDDRIVRKAENAMRDGNAVVRLAVDQHLQRLRDA